MAVGLSKEADKLAIQKSVSLAGAHADVVATALQLAPGGKLWRKNREFFAEKKWIMFATVYGEGRKLKSDSYGGGTVL